jgi:hypothetical protein
VPGDVRASLQPLLTPSTLSTAQAGSQGRYNSSGISVIRSRGGYSLEASSLDARALEFSPHAASSPRIRSRPRARSRSDGLRREVVSVRREPPTLPHLTAACAVMWIPRIVVDLKRHYAHHVL